MKKTALPPNPVVSRLISRRDTGRRGSIIDLDMEPIRTDFRGYEGQYVALDARTGKIVIADENPRIVLEKAKGRNHIVVRGRVPYADEPIYVGLG